MNFLEEVGQALAGVDLETATGPTEQTAEVDQVVGDMSDYLKRLYVVREEFSGAARRIKAAGLRRFAELTEVEKEPNSDQSLKELTGSYQLAKKRNDLMSEIFWLEVRREFPSIAAHPNIGVRVGWKVVYTNDSHGSILGGLLGAMGFECDCENCRRKRGELD